MDFSIKKNNSESLIKIKIIYITTHLPAATPQHYWVLRVNPRQLD